MAPPILEFDGIKKSFSGVPVLRGVSCSLRTGEILGLVGENGAGKSTLMNILGGVVEADAGEMRLAGSPFQPRSPRGATAQGITFIHQELNLFNSMSIEENLFITDFPTRLRYWPLIDRRKLRSRTRELLESLGLDRPPSELIENLSPGERQLVEIAKALSIEARIIILDEPTTSLSARELEHLFAVIGRLRERGISMIYISHVLAEVFRLCDRVAVMRDGEIIAERIQDELTVPEVISLMVGRSIDRLYPPRAKRQPGESALEVRALSKEGIIEDVSLTLRHHEVVGLFGLMGSGGWPSSLKTGALRAC